MTQAFNLSQLANYTNSNGQVDASTVLFNAVSITNGGTGASTATNAKINLQTITSITGSEILPKGTTAQRDGTPQAGYIRFNTDFTSFEGYNGTEWGNIGAGAQGGGSNQVFFENDQTVTTSYAITLNKSAMSTGPITINSSVTITVPSGSRWVVL